MPTGTYAKTIPSNGLVVDSNGYISPIWWQFFYNFLAGMFTVLDYPDLAAIEDVTGTGILTRTATNTWSLRTVAGTSPIVVTNGDGVSSNPTISLAASGITANTYGSSIAIPVYTVDIYGRLTATTNTAITYTYPSSGITQTLVNRLAVRMSVKDFGAVGDGITNDTTAINNAITALPASGGELYFPTGTYLITAPITINKSGTFYSDSLYASIITISHATATAVLISADYVDFSGFRITSSTGGRTGKGLHVTSSLVHCHDLYIKNHGYGIHQQGQANVYTNIITDTNATDGILIDGAIHAQNEVTFSLVQSNSNGQHGFFVNASTFGGLGVRLENVTAATNTKWGIKVSGINDVWINVPEISGNGGGISLALCSDVQITNPFIESSQTDENVLIGADVSLVSWVGGFVQQAIHATKGSGVNIAGISVAINGVVFDGHTAAGVTLASTASIVSLTGVICSSRSAVQAIGVKFNGATTNLTISGGEYSNNTAVSSGTIPTGTRIVNAGGFTDQIIDSTFTFVDEGDNTKKAAFQLSGITTGTTRTLTVPDASGTICYITGSTSIVTVGTVTTGTWNASIIGLAYGGTAANLTASNGGIVYSGAAALAILSGTATASKMLLSGSSAAPTWSTSTIPSSAGATANKVLLSDGTNYVLSTPTFPNASATSGKIIKSDGTNWVASTETYATPSTSGNVLTSDGTNWTSAAPAPTDAQVTFTDITTNNSSTTKHGFLKKLSNVATQYMDGSGAWSTPLGTQFVLISTSTPSASATVDFTGLSSTYFAYQIIFTALVPATANSDLWLRVSTDNGATFSATGYYYADAGETSAVAAVGVGANNAAQFILETGSGNGNGSPGCGVITVYNPSQSSTYHQVTWETIFVNNGGNIQSQNGGGLWLTTTAVDAVRLLMSSGNITSGIVKLYGIIA